MEQRAVAAETVLIPLPPFRIERRRMRQGLFIPNKRDAFSPSMSVVWFYCQLYKFTSTRFCSPHESSAQHSPAPEGFWVMTFYITSESII